MAKYQMTDEGQLTHNGVVVDYAEARAYLEQAKKRGLPMADAWLAALRDPRGSKAERQKYLGRWR